jgi:hypothetical protein
LVHADESNNSTNWKRNIEERLKLLKLKIDNKYSSSQHTNEEVTIHGMDLVEKYRIEYERTHEINPSKIKQHNETNASSLFDMLRTLIVTYQVLYFSIATSNEQRPHALLHSIWMPFHNRMSKPYTFDVEQSLTLCMLE